jgi:hypothetical protein
VSPKIAARVRARAALDKALEEGGRCTFVEAIALVDPCGYAKPEYTQALDALMKGSSDFARAAGPG